MPDARKRPCRNCRRWFRPDVRVGDRQHVCGEPDCQKARRWNTQASWRARNPGYATAYRIDQRNRDPDADLTRAAFHGWCQTQEHLTSGVRRVRMLEVHNFCAYRRRTEPNCFLPDPAAFPPYHQRAKPFIFSTTEVARLLKAAAGLAPTNTTPLRPEVTRLAIVLLFTTGIRRGELLNLTVGDYNRKEATLHIRETKFYKSRLLPINAQIADEIERYLRARTRRRLPIRPDTPLLWNARDGGRAYTGTGLLYCLRPLLQECGIRTLKGQPPRIHDLRQRADFLVMPTCTF